MDYRVTLTITSDSGQQYLYDDVTGMILPWNSSREAVLRTVLSPGSIVAVPTTAEAEEARDAAAFVQHWRQRYGAFLRSWTDDLWEPVPPVRDLEAFVRKHLLLQLILVLTEDCNMRCKYCAYSEVYPLNRVRTPRRMSEETARRAVDMFIQLAEPQLRRNPRRRFGLTFYGGEPLMNWSVLRSTLEYARSNYPGLFVPVMTTNGTLLTPDIMTTLVKHSVYIAVSVDGPPQEHDRLRVFPDGSGTHNIIMKNLRRLKSDYPEYWRQYVSTVCVFDWRTDLIAAEQFFLEEADQVPRCIFVNKVGSNNTSYYSQFDEEDRTQFVNRVSLLSEHFKNNIITGRPTSSYLRAFAGFPVIMSQLRQRFLDRRAPFLPFSGSCIPGTKVCVHVDGKMDICERVNGTYPVGYLRDGLSFERLGLLIDRYRRQVLYECPSCPVTKLCPICFSSVEADGSFSKPSGLCADTVERIRRGLSDYVSVLERNPDVDLAFETDVSRADTQLLLL